MMTREQELEFNYPSIQWREPLKVLRADGIAGLCCRLCIAIHGLKASDLEYKSFETEDDFHDHIKRAHP